MQLLNTRTDSLEQQQTGKRETIGVGDKRRGCPGRARKEGNVNDRQIFTATPHATAWTPELSTAAATTSTRPGDKEHGAVRATIRPARPDTHL